MQHEKKWIHAVKIYILIRLIQSTYSQCDIGAYEDENTGECVHTPLHNDLVTRIEGCDRGQHYNSVLQLCVDVPGGYYVSNYESLPVLGPCSRVDEDANLFYCPKGSPISPIPVPEGYYGVGGDGNKTREAIVLAEMGTFVLNGVRNHCPAGTYGDSEGLKQKNCSGLCTLGNFCPLGSSTPTPITSSVRPEALHRYPCLPITIPSEDKFRHVPMSFPVTVRTRMNIYAHVLLSMMVEVVVVAVVMVVVSCPGFGCMDSTTTTTTTTITYIKISHNYYHHHHHQYDFPCDSLPFIRRCCCCYSSFFSYIIHKYRPPTFSNVLLSSR